MKSVHHKIGFRYILSLMFIGCSPHTIAEPMSFERMAEFSFVSHKEYGDPFNDVDVDVIFSKDGKSWRVPTFWKGGQRWTVRFAPPKPGEYSYRLESTDATNPDLNGHVGVVNISEYRGRNDLLRHGAVRVSLDKRHFEQLDGTPFYWLGDTWWTGLSDRLSWQNFKTLTADRKAKGFTVVQVCAGLVPPEEEALNDPGFRNEGGAVWDEGFRRINPRYFDNADRRIQYLVDVGIAPAIVGGWAQILRQMGIAKVKKHWRYIIARYGAYPVFWIGGGEVYDPPHNSSDDGSWLGTMIVPGWTEVVRFIRDIDPYRHPLTVHELVDVSLQDPLLTDFDLIQPGHMRWASIGNEVAQLNLRYARIDVTKPIVVGEIGYETLGGTHLEDFQRVAFWLAMLNGAAGHTYGAAPTFEANNPQKPMHRTEYTFMTWEEGMRLPGSYQVGLGAKLLRQYSWWKLRPRPDWITPHGTTLLEPQRKVIGFGLGDEMKESLTERFIQAPELVLPQGDWKERHGDFRRPYAAGIDGKLRIIYMPNFGLFTPPPPTILNLEKSVKYNAYYWEPSLGIKIDLGSVAAIDAGAVIFHESFSGPQSMTWKEVGGSKGIRAKGKLIASGQVSQIVSQLSLENGVVSVGANSDSDAGILLRYQDSENYLAAIYSAVDKTLYFSVHNNGVVSDSLGSTSIGALGSQIRLSAEVRSNWVAAEITDGSHIYATPIIDIPTSVDTSKKLDVGSKSAGLLHNDDGHTQYFSEFEIRDSPPIPNNMELERKLYDARGVYRGELTGPGWDEYGKNKAILLRAFRPVRPPTSQDWVLVLKSEDDS